MSTSGPRSRTGTKNSRGRSPAPSAPKRAASKITAANRAGNGKNNAFPSASLAPSPGASAGGPPYGSLHAQYNRGNNRRGQSSRGERLSGENDSEFGPSSPKSPRRDWLQQQVVHRGDLETSSYFQTLSSSWSGVRNWAGIKQIRSLGQWIWRNAPALDYSLLFIISVGAYGFSCFVGWKCAFGPFPFRHLMLAAYLWLCSFHILCQFVP